MAVLPDIDQLFNIYDFHVAARQKLLHLNKDDKTDEKKKRKDTDAYNFYQTGVLDEMTLRENKRIFSKIWLRPRILVGINKCDEIDTSIELFGGDIKCSLPLYISASTRNNLAHKNGEIEIIGAAYNKDVIYMIPSASSIPFGDIIKNRVDKDQKLWFQLYTINSNKDKEKKYVIDKLNNAHSAGIKIICITVDSPSYLKRERYFKVAGNEWMAKFQPDLLNPAQDWKYIEWIIDNYCKKHGHKILLKGVQHGQDVLKAYNFSDHIVGVILSNHGGRQGSYARSGLEILIEAIDILNQNNIYLSDSNERKFDIFIDGGIRRGTDIFKALCLGAKMVGIGRPAIFGLTCYGQKGVERIIDIFRDELITCMQMMGVNSIKQIERNMIVYKTKNFHHTLVPNNHGHSTTYTCLPKL